MSGRLKIIFRDGTYVMVGDLQTEVKDEAVEKKPGGMSALS